jgi:hypothetical protein
MNEYFHSEVSREDANVKLRKLYQEQPGVNHVLFRTGSEPGTFAVSVISHANGVIVHYKVRQLDHRLGFDDDARGQVNHYMDVCVFLDTIKTRGTLARSPDPRPLF